MNSLYNTPDTLSPKKKRLPLSGSRTSLVIAVIISAIIPLWRCVFFLPQPPMMFYYGALGILAIMALLSARSRVNWSAIWFLCWCAGSIMLNTFSGYYSPWSRLFGLTMLLIAVGPMLANHRLLEWRKKALTVLLWGCVAISVISFLLYYIARPLTLLQGFMFQGITPQPMLLSPIAFVGTLFLVQYYMKSVKNAGLVYKILLWAGVAICLFAGILSGSRVALLSFLVAFVVWLGLFLRSTKKFLIVIGSIALVCLVSFPTWSSYTETLQDKMKASEKAGSLLSSRENLWEQRWDEFKSKPVFGIGFSQVKYTTEGVDTSKWAEGSGVVEPGNGWLFVLSSTGIGGFILIIWIYLKNVWKLVRLRSFEAMLALSMLIFIGVHNFAEGYMLSSGSFFCLVFWLCLGLSYCLPQPYKKPKWE